MTVLLELTYDIHIYLVHHYKKAGGLTKNEGGVYYPKYLVQQTEELL